jgi:hypothetical protein
MTRTIALALLASLLLLPALAHAGRPTLPILDAKQTERIEEGKLVLVQVDEGEGKAMVTGLIEIQTGPEKIWPILLSNDHIVAASRSVREVTTYRDVTTEGVRDLRIAFLMKIGFSEIRFHSHRTHYIDDQYMRWHLDEEKENDIASTIGAYSTWPGSKPGSTLFLYEARIDTGKNVPEWLEEELTEKTLKKYLVYVQEVAEGRE